MSIPFFYEPVRLKRSVLVDGGVLSNFPIDVFDRHNGMPRWPTRFCERFAAAWVS